MKTLNTLLSELDACNSAKNWAKDKTIEQVVSECERGDWLLWLYFRLDFDKRKLTLAKGLCANTVRHLMTDERSVKAVDAAIAYSNNRIKQQTAKICREIFGQHLIELVNEKLI